MDTPPRYLQGMLPHHSTPSHPIDQPPLDVSLFWFVDWYSSVELVPLVEFGEERTVYAMLRVYFAVWFMCYVAAYALDFVGVRSVAF
jgi:hypothetical protein